LRSAQPDEEHSRSDELRDGFQALHPLRIAGCIPLQKLRVLQLFRLSRIPSVREFCQLLVQQAEDERDDCELDSQLEEESGMVSSTF
jgi:hypothetical protein